MGEEDDVAVADVVVDADLAMGGVQLQVGDGVADGEPWHDGSTENLKASYCCKRFSSLDATVTVVWERAHEELVYRRSAGEFVCARWQPAMLHESHVLGSVATLRENVSMLLTCTPTPSRGHWTCNVAKLSEVQNDH
jgi:hypothetical protein